MGTPVMAIVVMAIIIPASMLVGRLVATFTRFERIEVKNAYVVNSGGNYIVTLHYENTGSSSTNIDYISLNDELYASYAPSIKLGGNFSTLPSSCETGSRKTGTIIIKAGATDSSGNRLTDGVTLSIKLHSKGNKNYYATVTLQGGGGSALMAQGDPGLSNSTPPTIPPADPINSTSPVNSTPSTIWRADFEEGNFSEIIKGGQGEIEESGNYAHVTIVTNPVFKGTYAVKCELGESYEPDKKAGINRWASMKYMKEAYYGVAFYLSLGFKVNDWALIMQLHTAVEPWGQFVQLEVNREGRLRLVKKLPSWELLWDDTEPVPTGKWVIAVMYLKAETDGQIKFWKNGELMTTVNGDFKSLSPDYVGPTFAVDLYCGSSDPAQWVVFDEMICASTLEGATPKQ